MTKSCTSIILETNSAADVSKNTIRCIDSTAGHSKSASVCLGLTCEGNQCVRHCGPLDDHTSESELKGEVLLSLGDTE